MIRILAGNAGRRLSAVFASGLFAIGVGSLMAQAPSIDRVTVDFSDRRPTPSMSGVLNGVDENTPDFLIPPLGLVNWRNTTYQQSAFDTPRYKKMLASGARIQLLLMGSYGVPGANVTRPWPYEDPASWEEVVRRAARGARSAGQEIYSWDVWNEADLPFYWGGTFDQFLDTYRRAYLVLRQELGPNALIAGPSLGRFDLDSFRRFLEYCRVNRLEVNILTWHELDDTRYSSIPDRVNTVRQLIASGDYESLRIGEIQLNEVIGPLSRLSPARILAYFSVLEAANVGSALRSCWTDSQNRNECFNGSLGGLIDIDSKQPRAAWWMHKSYADGVASRVATRTTANLVALGSASSDPAERAQVLIGYPPAAGATNAPRNVLLDVSGLRSLAALASVETVRIDLVRLAATGEQPMTSPHLVSRTDVAMSDTLQLTLDPLGVDEAYVVYLYPPPRH